MKLDLNDTEIYNEEEQPQLKKNKKQKPRKMRKYFNN